MKEYARDLLAENIAALSETDEGKRNLVELIEFALTFKTQPGADLQFIYPDLFSAYFEMDGAISMYKRFADEAFNVLHRYDGVRTVLPAGVEPPKKTSSRAKRPQRKARK